MTDKENREKEKLEARQQLKDVLTKFKGTKYYGPIVKPAKSKVVLP